MSTVELNGTEIWYSDSGGDGPVVLLHHGYNSSHDAWTATIDRLDPGRRYITMDARGTGSSGRPDDDSYRIETYVDDVIGVLDHLGVETCSYIGHSMGGGMGFVLGLDHADRLEKLVLVAPIPSGGIDGSAASHVEAERLWMERDEDRLIQERVVGVARPESVDLDRVKANVARLLSVSPGHYRGSWTSMDTFDVTDRLGELTTETLVIAGAADGLVRANVQDYLRLPNASLHVFNRVGHGPPNEIPDDFAEVIEDFLQHGVVTAQTLLDRIAAIDS